MDLDELYTYRHNGESFKLRQKIFILVLFYQLYKYFIQI